MPLPPLSVRLALLSGQVLLHHPKGDDVLTSPKRVELFRTFFDAEAEHFHSAHRERIEAITASRIAGAQGRQALEAAMEAGA